MFACIPPTLIHVIHVIHVAFVSRQGARNTKQRTFEKSKTDSAPYCSILLWMCGPAGPPGRRAVRALGSKILGKIDPRWVGSERIFRNGTIFDHLWRVEKCSGTWEDLGRSGKIWHLKVGNIWYLKIFESIWKYLKVFDVPSGFIRFSSDLPILLVFPIRCAMRWPKLAQLAGSWDDHFWKRNEQKYEKVLPYPML